MQDEIFGIVLNGEGRSQIAQLHKKVRIIFIGSVIWSVLNGLSLVVQIIKLKEIVRYSSRTNSQLVIVYVFWVLTIILLPLQAYYYYLFSKTMKLSIEEQNSEKFNYGFRLMSINATFVLLSLLVNFFNILYNVLSPFLR